MSKNSLIPADKTRCQAERKEGSFMTLGPRELIRCENIPVYIATEKAPGPDGQHGSMSLCVGCAEIFLKIYGKSYATLKVIQPEKQQQEGGAA